MKAVRSVMVGQACLGCAFGDTKGKKERFVINPLGAADFEVIRQRGMATADL